MRYRLPFLCAGLGLSLCAVPSLAVAEAVTVIRGGEVSVLETPEDFAREAERKIERPAPAEPRREPVESRTEEERPPYVVLIVPTREYPALLWQYASPWKPANPGRGKYGHRYMRIPRATP